MRTLKDRLSHLSFVQACKLLGPRGKALILEGGKFDIDLLDQVTLTEDHFRLTLGKVRVDLSLNTTKKKRLDLHCSTCGGACEHQGAALALILEEKLPLGLSAPPPQRKPMESLSEEALIKQAIAERQLRAIEEKMRLKSMHPNRLWTDYVITNQASGKSYRIAMRGWQPGESYCSCPDFRFDFDEIGLIRLFRTKNSKERTELLMPRTKQSLQDWRDHLEYMRKRKQIEVASDEAVFLQVEWETNNQV